MKQCVGPGNSNGPHVDVQSLGFMSDLLNDTLRLTQNVLFQAILKHIRVREPLLSTEGDATCSELMTRVSHRVPAAGSTSLAVMKRCSEGKMLPSTDGSLTCRIQSAAAPSQGPGQI